MGRYGTEFDLKYGWCKRKILSDRTYGRNKCASAEHVVSEQIVFAASAFTLQVTNRSIRCLIAPASPSGLCRLMKYFVKLKDCPYLRLRIFSVSHKGVLDFAIVPISSQWLYYSRVIFSSLFKDDCRLLMKSCKDNSKGKFPILSWTYEPARSKHCIDCDSFISRILPDSRHPRCTERKGLCVHPSHAWSSMSEKKWVTFGICKVSILNNEIHVAW